MTMLSRDVPERVSLTLVSQGEQVKVSTIGGRAYLVDAPGEFDLPAQRRIWALAALLRQRDDIESLIPGVTNLLVLFKHIPPEPSAIVHLLQDGWERARAAASQGKRIDIPVCYGGEHATDLDAVCEFTGLTAKEVIRRHYQGEYTVFALGSAPGFGYLHGLDPVLATPRKKVPSLNMLKGTVTIGGAQTGVSALTGPNGWNAIGFADMPLFDPWAETPAVMAPGDSIRFLPERIEL